MVTARGDARAKAQERTGLPKRRTENEAAEFIRSAHRKIHKRAERKNFRYHYYA